MTFLFILLAAFLLEGCSKNVIKEDLAGQYTGTTIQDTVSSEAFAPAEEPVTEDRQWVKGKYIPLGTDERLNRLVSEEGDAATYSIAT